MRKLNNIKSDGFKCDFCHATSFEERNDIKTRLGLAADEYAIIECAECHLVSFFPQPSQQKLIEFYQDYGSKKNRQKDEEYRQKSIYPQKLRKLKEYTSGSRLLDIGAGMGTFAFMAKKEGFDVTGLELSPEQCQRAKELYGVNLLNRNVFEIKDDLGKFDIIHLHHVMEHLTAPSRMFDIARELLSDDGILLIEVPYQLTKVQDLFKRRRVNDKLKFNYDHLFFFSPKTMKNYIKSRNFEIIEFSQHYLDEFSGSVRELPWHFLRRILRKITTLLWIPSGLHIEFYCRKKKGFNNA